MKKLLFTFLFVFLLSSSFIFTSFAAEHVYTDESEYNKALTGYFNPDDTYILLDDGSVSPGESSVSSFSSLFSGSSTYALESPKSSPNFSWFDPKQVPFYDYPDYVQDIAYKKLEKFDVTSANSQQAPFICIVVTSSSSATIYAGINAAVCWVGNTSSGSTSAYGIVWRDTHFGTYSSSVMYKATINSNYELTSSWEPYDGNTYTTTGETTSHTKHYYTLSSANANRQRDLYCFGVNMTKSWNGDYYSLTAALSDTLVYSYRAGYFSSINQSLINITTFSNTYTTTFSPQTAEQQAENTRKGILETLRNVPSMIADGIKGLFVPDEVQMGEAVGDFRDVCEQHLGIIYQCGDFVDKLFNQLKDYIPKTEGYTLTFPSIEAAYIDDQGEVQHKELSKEQDFSLSDIVSQSPWSTLYTAYRTLVWVVFLVALLNLAQKKFSSIIGGSD